MKRFLKEFVLSAAFLAAIMFVIVGCWFAALYVALGGDSSLLWMGG